MAENAVPGSMTPSCQHPRQSYYRNPLVQRESVPTPVDLGNRGGKPLSYFYWIEVHPFSMGLRDWEAVKSLGGSEDSITADGVFLVTKLHIAFIEEEAESWGVESIETTDWQTTLVDAEQREFKPATGVAAHVSRDDRFEPPVMTPERLHVGDEVIRTVVFDVPPNRTYRLKGQITSVGETSLDNPITEFMDVGTVELPV